MTYSMGRQTFNAHPVFWRKSIPPHPDYLNPDRGVHQTKRAGSNSPIKPHTKMNEINIFNQIILGVTLFAFGVLMQTLFTLLIHKRIGQRGNRRNTGIGHAAVRLFLSMSSLIVSAVIQSIVWAAVYVKIGAFEGFYHSLFFSLSCFSTLGFANFLPADHFKLLSALEGISGSLNMAWAGGIMYSLVNGFYAALKTHPSQSTAHE